MKQEDFYVYLLGQADISYQGKLIKIPRRVERGIFYYLLIEQRMITREQLIDLLWPEANMVDPRGLIRTALSRLRSQLPIDDMLITSRNQVTLDCSKCVVDLVKFEESYQSLGNILSAFPTDKELPIQIVNQIKESLDLWKGDDVFQGEDFSDYADFELWRQTLGKNLKHQRLVLKKRLAEHYRATGQLEFALGEFLHLARLNQSDTELHLVILDILIKLGRLQEALEFCDDLEIIYEREYNAPLPDAVLKYCQQAQHLINTTNKTNGSEWPLPSPLLTPLVGRTKELEQLKQMYYRGGLVVLNGNLGVGKTRLVQALFESLVPRPMLIFAVAKEGETSLPFAPIISGIRQSIPKEILQDLDSVWANHLSLILPEMVNIRSSGDIQDIGKLPFYRQHLLESIYQLFLLTTKTYGRVLFFLDDAHWADYQTLITLSYLASRGLFTQNNLIIIAVNAEYPQQNLQKTLNQLRQEYFLQTISLPGFNPDEMRTLIQSVINHPPTIELVDRMYNETKGNPLMALLILRHMLDISQKVEDLMQIDPLPLPESIYKIIEGRFNSLTEDARQVLKIAAVIGNDISLNLLQSASEFSHGQFLPALDQLIQTGFIFDQPVSHLSEKYVHFIHEKAREIVTKDISLASRQLLNQKIAHILSHSPRSSEQAAIIANHYLAAGFFDRAFEWLLKAANYAWSLASREEAFAAYLQAEEILDQLPPSDFNREYYLQLYDQMSKFAYQSSQITLLEEIGVKAQQLGARFSDEELIGLANLSFAYACFFRDNFETGLMLTQNTIDYLDKKRHPELLIRTLYYRATFQWWTLDFDGLMISRDQMIQALKEIPKDDTKRKPLEFLIQILQVNFDYAKGNTENALKVAEEIQRDFFDHVSIYDKLLIYYNLSRSNYLAGNISQCINFANEAMKMAQALENKYHEIFTLNNLSKYQLIYGHLDEVFEHANKALNLAEAENKLQEAAAASTLLGDLHGFLNNYPQAFRHYRIAQIRQGYSYQYYHALENHIHLASWLTRNNQLAEAKQIIKECLKVTEQKGMTPLYLQSLMADGLIDMRENNIALANLKIEKAVDLAKEKGLMMDIYWGKLRMAQFAIEEQKYKLAEDLLLDILESASEKGLVTIVKQAFELIAKMDKNNYLQMDIYDLKETYETFIEKIDLHTQTEPLRQLFQKAHHEEE